jgi:hypothetical protein
MKRSTSRSVFIPTMRSKSRLMRLGLFAVFLVTALGNSKLCADEPQVSDLEREILASRRLIKSGEFKIDVTSGNEFRPEAHYHTWFTEGGRIRQELRFKKDLQVSLFNPESAAFYNTRGGDLADPMLTQRPLLRLVPVAEAKPNEDPFYVCPPTLLMLVPAQFELLISYHDDSHLASQGREALEVHRATWKDLPAFTVSYTKPVTGNVYEYDVVPSRGYSIVEWRMRGATRGRIFERFQVRLTCQLKEIERGIWFPDILEYTSKWETKPPSRETVQVEVISINRPIDDKVFTLAFDRLPAGQVIAQYLERMNGSRKPATQPAPATIKPLLYWDGEKIRPMTQQDEEDRKQLPK